MKRKDILVRRNQVRGNSYLVASSQYFRNQGLGIRAEKRNEVPCNEFFQKALAYEKTIAREGGILMPH